MTFRFDEPLLLLLALLAVPILFFGLRALRTMDRLRRAVVLTLRIALIVALAVLLARPRSVQEHRHLTVVGLLDISGSVKRFAQLRDLDEEEVRSNIDYLRRWFRQATQMREPDDRFGLIVFDGDALAISAPTGDRYVDDNLDVAMVDGTNIAEAVRLGLAIFPSDTARRLVLVTDGNETTGSVLEAVREAMGRGSIDSDAVTFEHLLVPIDVLPIAYHVPGDVQVARVEAPPHAQPGQTVTVRMILEAARATTGRLTLRREDVPIDLNGAEAGVARHVALPAGPSVHLAQVPLGATPINRFVAIFEPDDPAADALPENNRAEAFTATPGRGTMLLVDPLASRRTGELQQILQRSGMPVEVEPPSAFPNDLLALQNFDLVLLDNVAASELTPPQHELLSRYVHDLGGGLIMIGGDHGFGAGGWNGTRVEDVLPVELDPQLELRTASAALVLVLDRSGSMNRAVAGARASQQQVANEAAALAIESLRSDSLVGVITFNMRARTLVPLQRNQDSARIAEIVRGITADGGTNLDPALRRAYQMLREAEAKKKRVVCLSDGQSITTDLEPIARAMADDDIALTTIAVGDDADHQLLHRLATVGNGQFYDVRNPRTLPRVLVDSVQVLNKPLIKEGSFTPVVRPTGSALTLGMDSAPALGGLVITAPKNDPTVLVEMTHPEGEPLLAHWQAGLGRVAAFTSDVGGTWSSAWTSWPEAEAFWKLLARTIARPPMSTDAELETVIRNDRLEISFDAARSDDRRAEYLLVEGTVYLPDGQAVDVRLDQTAPGRYEASIPATAPGSYVVALSPRRGHRRLAPAIGGVSKSSSPEFRQYQSNIGLLEKVAEMTGGRRLDPGAPTAVDLFDRRGLPAGRSALPMWRSVLWAALGLLLLDVASRRIAWNATLLRTLLARALARVVPARVHGTRAAATLASLRQVSAEVDERLAAQTEHAATRRASRAPEETVQHPPPAAQRARPDAGRISAALDAFLGRGTSAASAKARSPSVPPSPTAAGPAESAEETSPQDAEESTTSETTSSLLAAKRRARERYQKDGE